MMNPPCLRPESDRVRFAATGFVPILESDPDSVLAAIRSVRRRDERRSRKRGVRSTPITSTRDGFWIEASRRWIVGISGG